MERTSREQNTEPATDATGWTDGMTTDTRPGEGFAPETVDELVTSIESTDSAVVGLCWRDADHNRTTFALDVTPVPAVGGIDEQRVDVRDVVDDTPVAQSVPFAAVQSVLPVPDAGTATELLPDDSPRRAALLRGLAEHAPALVDLPVVLTLLDREAEPTAVVTDALASLTALASERPTDCAAALPRVRTLLSAGPETAVTEGALTCLTALAAARPEEVAPHVETVSPALSSSNPFVVQTAVSCVSHVASVDPESVVDTSDVLFDLLDVTDADVRMHAAYTLGRVAVVAPELVRPEVVRLAGVVEETTERTATRLNATCAVGRVAGECPGAVVDHLEPFVAALADADAGVRANAAGVVGDVAVTHAVAVRRHAPALVRSLDDDDGVTRANVSTALARVAREFPEALCDHVDPLVGRLEDEEPLVRENVCWALGYLRDDARAARPMLERVRTDDGDERVRGRAEWALDEVGDEGVGGDRLST